MEHGSRSLHPELDGVSQAMGAALMYVCAVYGGALVVFGIGRLVFSFITEMELLTSSPP